MDGWPGSHAITLSHNWTGDCTGDEREEGERTQLSLVNIALDNTPLLWVSDKFCFRQVLLFVSWGKSVFFCLIWFFSLAVIFISLDRTRNPYSYLKRLVYHSRYSSFIWAPVIWALFQLLGRRTNQITLTFQFILYFRTDTEFVVNAVNNMVNLKIILYRPTVQHVLYRRKKLQCRCHTIVCDGKRFAKPVIPALFVKPFCLLWSL